MYKFLFFVFTAISLNMKHDWRLVNEKHWQIVPSESAISHEEIDQIYGGRGSCPPGMVQINGIMKQDLDPNPYGNGTIEFLQKTTCTNWINKNYPERCAVFDREQWLKISETLDTKPMNFCIDRFEYPNQLNQYPLIYISWYEAKELCENSGKRLCTEEEWTFACEGEEATPYPYGYVRDDTKCVIDKKWIPYYPSKLRPREQAVEELDRLWQGELSGSRPLCKSSFGVYDLTGNVDEWTVRSRRDGKYNSILKGGYWGPVRTRCRPSTRSHNANHIFYQQSFRCCV